MLNKYKLYIFDVDGTLVMEDINKWYELTKGLGVSLQEHEQIFANMMQGKLDTQTAIAQIAALWSSAEDISKDKFRESLEQVQLRAGALEMVQGLHQAGARTTIITGTPELHLLRVMELLGIEEGETYGVFEFDEADQFLGLTYPSDTATRKVEILEKFLANTPIKLEECVMIGDGPNDLKVMEMVGLSCAPADSKSELVLDMADIVFTDFFDLERQLLASS